MKAVTIRPPWPHAIVLLPPDIAKDVENRTRNIAGTYRGALAIHVSTTGIDQAGYATIERITGQPMPDVPIQAGFVIGVVDLVDVHRYGTPGVCEPRAVCSPWAETHRLGLAHLVLANPRPLIYPMWAVGHLGLWDIDDAKILPRLEAVA